MTFLNFIINNILTEASITIAIVAMLGLLIQKKPGGEVASGTFKTMLGFLVLTAGSGVIIESLEYFGEIFAEAFGLEGIIPSIEAINGQAMGDLGLGNQIALTFLAIFVVNIILARITRFKYIFLTGQALLWMATMTTVFGYYGGLRGYSLIIFGGIIGGLFAVLMPAIAQPFVRKITDSDEIALGHFCTIGYAVTAGVSKAVGDKSKSTEDIDFPKGFSFLQDTYLGVGAIMVPLYIVAAAFAGPEFSSQFSGEENYIVYAFLQGVQFVVGVYILLAGVRLLLAEIVPAFRGIAMKIVPNAKPALDAPVLFPYAPQAVTIGFVFTTLGTVIAMFLLPLLSLPVLLPGMLTNFFAGGTAGIFGNAVGGRRGTMISGIVHGLFITILPALLVPVLGDMGFTSTTATDSDTIVAALLYDWIINPILSIFT